MLDISVSDNNVNGGKKGKFKFTVNGDINSKTLSILSRYSKVSIKAENVAVNKFSIGTQNLYSSSTKITSKNAPSVSAEFENLTSQDVVLSPKIGKFSFIVHDTCKGPPFVPTPPKPNPPSNSTNDNGNNFHVVSDDSNNNNNNNSNSNNINSNNNNSTVNGNNFHIVPSNNSSINGNNFHILKKLTEPTNKEEENKETIIQFEIEKKEKQELTTKKKIGEPLGFGFSEPLGYIINTNTSDNTWDKLGTFVLEGNPDTSFYAAIYVQITNLIVFSMYIGCLPIGTGFPQTRFCT